MECYDAHLRFSTLKLDIRLLFLISFLAKCMWLLYQNHTRANALDGLNIAALLYGFSPNAPVGLEEDLHDTVNPICCRHRHPDNLGSAGFPG